MSIQVGLEHNWSDNRTGIPLHPSTEAVRWRPPLSNLVLVVLFPLEKDVNFDGAGKIHDSALMLPDVTFAPLSPVGAV